MEPNLLDTADKVRTVIEDDRFPVIDGVGYYGCNPDEVDKTEDSYTKWKNMIHRGFNDATQKSHPYYIGCTVEPEWLNYSNFKRWYDANVYPCT